MVGSSDDFKSVDAAGGCRVVGGGRAGVCVFNLMHVVYCGNRIPNGKCHSLTRPPLCLSFEHKAFLKALCTGKNKKIAGTKSSTAPSTKWDSLSEKMCFYSNNIHNPLPLRLSIVCVHLNNTTVCCTSKGNCRALGALAV